MRNFKSIVMRVFFLSLMCLMLALPAFADDTAISTAVTDLVTTISGYIPYVVSLGFGCLAVFGVTKMFHWIRGAIK